MSLQSGDEDASQFDSRFTKLTPFDSPVDGTLSSVRVLTYTLRSVPSYIEYKCLLTISLNIYKNWEELQLL